MLELLRDSQDIFDEIVSAKTSIDSPDEIVSDAEIADELRLMIEGLVQKYETKVRESGCDENLRATRVAELERMLFKLADAIINQAKENAVNDVKNRAYEQIDDILCTEMCDGTFSNAEAARKILQNFIAVYAVTKQALEELPFLQRAQIERAQDDLSEYIEDLIRRIQMVYAYHFDENSMRLIMDLGQGETDSNSDSSAESESESESASSESSEAEIAAISAVAIAAKEDTKKKAAPKSTPAKASKESPKKTATPKATPKKAAPKDSAAKKTPAASKPAKKAKAASAVSSEVSDSADRTPNKRKRNVSSRLRDYDEPIPAPVTAKKARKTQK